MLQHAAFAYSSSATFLRHASLNAGSSYDLQLICELTRIEAQVQHHVMGLADTLPRLTNLLIVHGLLGVHPEGSLPQHSPFALTPTQQGQQLMAALTSVELPHGPGKAQASLLHLTARQFHMGDAVRRSLEQVCFC